MLWSTAKTRAPNVKRAPFVISAARWRMNIPLRVIQDGSLQTVRLSDRRTPLAEVVSETNTARRT